jgi:hypothetical protein
MQTVLRGLSLVGNLVKAFMYLYGTGWRERGYGLSRDRSRISVGPQGHPLPECYKISGGGGGEFLQL